MKKLLTLTLALTLALPTIVSAQTVFNIFRGLVPETNSTYYLGTTTPSTRAWKSLITDQVCLTADTCRTTWPSSSGGGGGSGNVATSSAETSSRIPFWTSTGATPALLSGGNSSFTFNSGNNLLTALSGLFTYASTTNFLATGSSTLQNFTFINATGTKATTTAFAISNIVSSLLKTDANGSIIPAILGTDYIDRSENNYKEAAKYGTTAALPTVVYANGASGVGATLTAVALGAISLDGNAPSVNDRVLVKNQASTFQNGIYNVTAVGSVGAVFVLTRATDFDQAADILTGDALFVTSGTTQSSTTWSYTGGDAPVMGTDPITFVQVAGQGSFTGGTGITITGTSIAVDQNFAPTWTGAHIFNNITRSTTTSATTSNLFAFLHTGSSLLIGGTATTTINSTGDLFVAGSSTLQRATSAISFFSPVSSSTQLWATNATTSTHFSSIASSTELSFTTLRFDGINGDSWDDFCVRITGAAGLCDGNDATGAGGGGVPNSKWATSSPITDITPNAAIGVVMTRSTSTSASSTNLFADVFTANTLRVGQSATSTINSAGDLLVVGSTTLQNFTFRNATGTYATTTNLFSTVSSSTSLFSGVGSFDSLTLNTPLTVANGGSGAKTLTGILLGNGASAYTALTTSAGIFGAISDETGGSGFMVGSVSPALTGTPTLTGYISSASSTIIGNFTITGSATATQATTTNLFSTTASSTNLFASAVTFGQNIWTLLNQTITAGVTAIIDYGSAISFEIVNGSGPVVDATGEIAVDTTSDQLIYFGASAKKVIRPFETLGFAYATTTWSGTTTLRIGPAPAALTVTDAYCETDAGTTGVSLWDGTNRALYMVTASTTINKFNYTASNNSFTAGETIRVDVGTPASSPRYLSCRFLYTYDAD